MRISDWSSDVCSSDLIYAENRSFNNLFGDFPGVEQPLSGVAPERALQRDRDGSVLERLPPIWEGLVPHRQVVEHREYLIDEKGIAPLPNAPFALSTPEGEDRKSTRLNSSH